MRETLMERIYLYVAPEEYVQVRLAGAAWDGASKRWYVPAEAAATDFARWLGDDPDEVEFGIASNQAFVVSATTACVECLAEIEVICLYVERGFDEERGEAIERATVSNVWAMDEGLRAQVGNWSSYREIGGAEADARTFANHCVHCGAVQEDYRLHSEPGDVFFSVTEAEPGSLTFTPLMGVVRMSGDFAFGV